MLIQPIPQRIPHEDNSVDEVRLEGTFNMAIARETRQALLVEAFRVLRPGGRIWVHGLVGDKPFVEVSLGGWDTHYDNFDSVKNLCGTLDRPWAALMQDLKDRGLLETTTIV